MREVYRAFRKVEMLLHSHGAQKYHDMDTGAVRDYRSADYHVKKCLGHLARWRGVDKDSGRLHLIHAAGRLLLAIERLIEDGDLE